MSSIEKEASKIETALEFLLLLEKMDNPKLLKLIDTFRVEGQKDEYYIKVAGAIEKYRRIRFPDLPPYECPICHKKHIGSKC